MSLFFFVHRNSLLHRFDPRVKITGLGVFCLLAVATESLRAMGLILALQLWLFLFSGSTVSLKKMAGFFMLITAMTFVMWTLFFRSDEVIWRAGILSVHAGAISHAAMMALRFLNMLLSGLLFLSITSIEDFFGGMILMGVPYPFAFAVSLSFRLVMVFMTSAAAIVEAQKVRGNDITRGHILRRIRAYAPLVAPLILTGIKKAETLTLALESKGFSPRNRIDLSGKYRLAPPDKWCLAALALGTLLTF